MKLLRKLYIKTTNLTHGYQDNHSKIISFYKLWAPLYDISIKLDPAYQKNLKQMINEAVSQKDFTLDVGCGTGLGTIHAATIAQYVLGFDPSMDMLNRLKKKIEKEKIANVKLREGFFPQALKPEEKFQSIISSFMLVHLSKKQRTTVTKSMYDVLEFGGRLGLFSAQGEIAPAFQTKEEIRRNLSQAGFQNIAIKDVDDIYRISIAVK